jgi:hypothetical protein
MFLENSLQLYSFVSELFFHDLLLLYVFEHFIDKGIELFNERQTPSLVEQRLSFFTSIVSILTA